MVRSVRTRVLQTHACDLPHGPAAAVCACVPAGLLPARRACGGGAAVEAAEQAHERCVNVRAAGRERPGRGRRRVPKRRQLRDVARLGRARRCGPRAQAAVQHADRPARRACARPGAQSVSGALPAGRRGPESRRSYCRARTACGATHALQHGGTRTARALGSRTGRERGRQVGLGHMHAEPVQARLQHGAARGAARGCQRGLCVSVCKAQRGQARRDALRALCARAAAVGRITAAARWRAACTRATAWAAGPVLMTLQRAA